MVKAAYSSGKPAIGVGAGNTPVVIDETADIKRAVASVLMSKTFDNGVIWLAAGESNKEIGRALNISTGTVKAHLESLYRRLEVKNRIHASGLASL